MSLFPLEFSLLQLKVKLKVLDEGRPMPQISNRICIVDAIDTTLVDDIFKDG